MAPNKTLKEVKVLGTLLLSSRKHINNLPLLINFVSPEYPPQYVLESLLSLQSFFTPLLPQLRRINNEDTEDAQVIYKAWLHSKFDELLSSLFHLLSSAQPDDALREIVLDSIMEFVKLGNGGKFHSPIYHKLLLNLVYSEALVDFMLDSLVSKYFNYIDIRYFTYISLEKIATILKAKDTSDDSSSLIGSDDKDDKARSRESLELFIRRTHFILSHIPALETLKEDSDYELWSGSGLLSVKDESKEHSGNPVTEKKQPNCEQQKVLSGAKIARRMKLKFTKAWVSFLRLPLPVDVYKEVLVSLHQAVIPHLSNPKILCDFLTRSYDIGGVVSVMALSSLFILMTEHGLEYPNFYEKLYALLLPSIFLAKHRAKFFQLLDSCLKSPLLPAYLAAAFAKKLSRLALTVPPSGALVIIALIHNLLRRHPSINCLVHREDDGESVNNRSEVERENSGNASDSGTGMKQVRKPGLDHFDNEESNPLKSNALRSSLWEIDTLRHHYCPPVSRFVLSLENDLTVRSKSTEVAIKDFSSGSYATIFGSEIRRRVKQVPLAFYKAIPTSLFNESDFGGWTFKIEGSEERTGENGMHEENAAKRQRLEG